MNRPALPTPHAVPVATSSGYTVPVQWYVADSGRARANLVLMAALGVAARFYQPLAATLCASGVNVALVEQRGHGDSALRPSRRCNFGFREALLEDIPAVLDWLDAQAPGLPRILMGHSLGGHYAAITAGRLPDRVDGVIVAACGSPWIGGFAGRTQRQLGLLVRIIPLLTFLFGFYPGDRVGFGGREARRLMADWRDLAQTNRYRVHGVDEDFDAAIARYTGPVLSLRLADDSYAPETAMAAVTDKFRAAPVTKVVIDAAELGDRADHFRWARTPAAVVHHVAAWLDGLAPHGVGRM